MILLVILSTWWTRAYGWIALVLYGWKKKIEKNKSDYGENLSRTLDRARLVVYKSSIFPTVSFLVSEKIEFYGKNAPFSVFLGKIKSIFSKISWQNKYLYIVIIYQSKAFQKENLMSVCENFPYIFTHIFKRMKVSMAPSYHQAQPTRL